MNARIEWKNEVSKSYESGWILCFQYCKYCYDGDIEPEYGYRFIWRRPGGTLQAARGQARIPNVSDILYLISKAIEEGWANNNISIKES